MDNTINNKIKELSCDFYLLDNKLLYISKDFVGFDPRISKGFLHRIKRKSGTTITHESFKIGDTSFDSILTYFIDWGPLRGFERIEILRNGRIIINHEWGGMGHGSNYSKGDDFYTEDKDAFLIKSGGATENRLTNKIYSDLINDNYYLFWFKKISIPIIHNSWPEDGSLYEDRIYSRPEIEPLVQIQWEATMNLGNDRHIYIKKEAVPHCLCVHLDTERNIEEFQGMDNITELDKISIYEL